MSTTKLGLSVFFIVISLVLLAIAFATDHWEVWMVDRESLRAEAATIHDSEDARKLNTDPAYFTRYHGLLRSCYPGNDTADMLKDKTVIDEYCIYVDYQLSEAAQYLSNKSADYWMAMHVRRLLFGLVVMGMVLLLLSMVGGTYGCWAEKSGGTTVTAILVFLALLMLTGAIGTVFGLNFLLTHRVPEYIPSPLLKKHSAHILSWSFYLLCSSTAVCLLAFLLVTIVAYGLYREKALARRAAEKMRKYYDDLQKKNAEPNFHYDNRAPSPLQRAVSEQNGGGEKMVPILMFDNAGFESDKGILY